MRKAYFSGITTKNLRKIKKNVSLARFNPHLQDSQLKNSKFLRINHFHRTPNRKLIGALTLLTGVLAIEYLELNMFSTAA